MEVFCVILPSGEGFVESLIVNGLAPGEQYYFAVASIDMAGNESEMSNVAVLTTTDNLPEIHSMALSAGGLQTGNGAGEDLVITGANFLGAAGTNIVRF